MRIFTRTLLAAAIAGIAFGCGASPSSDDGTTYVVQEPMYKPATVVVEDDDLNLDDDDVDVDGDVDIDLDDGPDYEVEIDD